MMKYTVLKRTLAAFAAGLMLLQTPLQAVASTVSVNSAETAASVSDNSLCEELLLDYTYIESGYLQPGAVQNVVVSLVEEDMVFDGAQLFLINETTGQPASVPVKEITGNTLLFSFATTGYDKGVYRIEKVTCGNRELTFAQIPGMENVCFGLGVENPLSEAAFTSYDSTELMDVNVVSLNAEEPEGDISRQVETAIRAAQSELSADGEELGADTGAVAETRELSRLKAAAENTVIVIDPGHDATHAGARANGLLEEELTLKVAQYCKAYLEANYGDVTIYLTRTGAACPYPGTDSGNCNANRVEASHRVGADAYVSIHFNSTAGTTTASGAMVFYPNGNYNSAVGSAGQALAARILEELAGIGLKNNGIRIRNSENNTTYEDGSLADYYAVIKRSKLYGFPGVIVEHAFINNPQDAAFLKNEGNLKKLGEADALGIAKAFGLGKAAVEYEAEELQVTDVDGVNGTFKMRLIGAAPQDKIANVKFKVYPTDEADNAYTYTAEKESKGIYSACGDVSRHGMAMGEYTVESYVCNAAGKEAKLLTATFTIQEEKAVDVTLVAKPNASEKKVTLTLKKNANAAAVSFKVYSKEGGKDDLKTYKAAKNAKGQWVAVVTVANHKTAGEYVVAAYSKSYYGKTSKVAEGGFEIEGPTARKVKVVKENLNKGTFQIRAYDVESLPGIAKVSIQVKNLDGKKKTRNYTAKKHFSGFYYTNIDMKDHNYEYGRYKIKVIVTDKNGITKTVQTMTHTVEKPEPKVNVKLKSRQTKLTMSAANLGLAANVKAVKFRVYNTERSSKKKDYEAKKSADGTWTATAKIADFGASGTYKILTYVKGANGKYKKLGKAAKVTVADITGGMVTYKKKSNGGFYVYVGDIKTKAPIIGVEVKVWNDTKKTAKKSYKATLLSNGKYRANVALSAAEMAGGTYKYQVYVTTQNGICKKVAGGTLAQGEDSPVVNGLYTISGDNTVTVAQMVSYYNSYAQYPSYYKKSDAPSIEDFCRVYYDECKKEGIRVEVAFTQAMKETGFLRFGGDVSISQYNFAGIGAVGGGASGQSFASVELGVRAQVQHLKAYANAEPLNDDCVDPRFHLVTRGCAPYVEWLGIPENPYGKGWAADPSYGINLRKMIDTLKTV